VQPFVLDGPPGTPPAGHGRWQGADAPSARAASLASSAALPHPPGGSVYPAQLGGGDPYGNPYVNAYGIPCAAGGVPLASVAEGVYPAQCPFGGPVGRKNRGRLAPLRGSGAARPQGALRAIDPSACPRSWRTYGPRRLRRQSQPDLAATQGGRWDAGPANLALDRRGQGCCGDPDGEESTWQPTAGIRQRPTGC
jgi:hypothetical protein